MFMIVCFASGGNVHSTYCGIYNSITPGLTEKTLIIRELWLKNLLYIRSFSASWLSERQISDNGEWSRHRLQAGPATPHSRAAGGTAEGNVCFILVL